jgi:hypothetical protein
VIEGGGEKILAPRPGVLGAVPVRGSLSPEKMEEMEPVSKEEWFYTPSSIEEWEDLSIKNLEKEKS